MIVSILQAKNWLHPDITKKYKNSVESLLSYSRRSPTGENLQKMPNISANNQKTYEIAYLGLSDVEPVSSEASDTISDLISDNNRKLTAIH